MKDRGGGVDQPSATRLVLSTLATVSVSPALSVMTTLFPFSCDGPHGAGDSVPQ